MALWEIGFPIFQTHVQWKDSLHSEAQWKRIYWGLILFEILYFEKFFMRSSQHGGFSLHAKIKHTSHLVIYDNLWNMFFLIGSHQVYQVCLRFRGRSKQRFSLFKCASNCFSITVAWLLAHCPPVRETLRAAGTNCIKVVMLQIPAYPLWDMPY